jgi:hypothetical protein
MKTFDEVEKQIIKEIVFSEGHKSFVNLFHSMKNLQGVRIRIDKASRKASFLFQTDTREPSDDELTWAIERRKQLTELLLRYVILFKYLDNEELAIFFNPTTDFEDPVIFGMGADNMDYVTSSIDDQYIVDLLLTYVSKQVLPSPSLRQLVNNDFLYDEEIRFRSMRNIQWATVTVAILIGLAGICLNIVGIYQHRNSIDYRPVLKEITNSLDRIDTDTHKRAVAVNRPAASKGAKK